MLRRLAHSIFLATIAILSACSPHYRKAADRLNSLSYAYHYSSLDSTEYYANRAIEAARDYPDGTAEALNNLAFVRIAQMRYGEAERLLEQVHHTTDNQVELFVACVQQMRLCQRRSYNRDFYDRRQMALRAQRRIDEEREALSDRSLRRLAYAESELAIVTSTYYYYVGMEQMSRDALTDFHAEIETDTAQYLNYLYNIGSGGIVSAPTQDEVNQQEFDYLMRCYLMATKTGNDYFKANALEAIAEHLLDDGYRDRLLEDNMPALKYLNPEGTAPDSLPLALAEKALSIFTAYGDVYQIAGAHRSLASCYLGREDYDMALHHLNLALSDTLINQAPDLVASIREQLSVAYAAVDDKEASDMNRDEYLLLQEDTRQDRSLEARAMQLEQAASQLNTLIIAVVAAIAILMLLILLSVLHYRRQGKKKIVDDDILQQEEELEEQTAMARLNVERGRRLALEQRAKVSMVTGIMPLIDRIVHETARLTGKDTDAERLEYISELADNINFQNNILTHWIQLRQGELSLHIETFELQPLFDIVAMGRRAFAIKGITLSVTPTDALVKADRVLTLFMLNTLADNARKFTPQGGTVTISATEGDGYVEMAVQDSGCGMDEQQLARLFVAVPQPAAAAESTTVTATPPREESHGFGLLNCKGIIDKYRKLSPLFSVCAIQADSHPGKGSRFAFRLPKGVARAAMSLFFAATVGSVMAQAGDARQSAADTNLTIASALCDSVYQSNLSATYERTLVLADSCRQHLNAYYQSLFADGNDTLRRYGESSMPVAEVEWLRSGVELNYDILLILRNESAVAALALHEWPLYQYNNRVYTQLLKELTADSTLEDYCSKMQRSQSNKQVAVILLVILLLAIILALAWQMLLAIGRASRRRQQEQDRIEMARDSLARLQQEEAALHVSNAVLDNCLSALKHETMYYPSRIRQLIDNGDTDALPEVAAYYRELYTILAQQALRQTEHTRPQMQRLDEEVMGDPVLVRFLMEILRKQNGKALQDVKVEPRDDKYVCYSVPMPGLRLSDQQAATLFTPASENNIPFLLCRQIVRDHGEATGRRASAIRAEKQQGMTMIIITLPRIWKNSKLSS